MTKKRSIFGVTPAKARQLAAYGKPGSNIRFAGYTPEGAQAKDAEVLDAVEWYANYWVKLENQVAAGQLPKAGQTRLDDETVLMWEPSPPGFDPMRPFHWTFVLDPVDKGDRVAGAQPKLLVEIRFKGTPEEEAELEEFVQRDERQLEPVFAKVHASTTLGDRPQGGFTRLTAVVGFWWKLEEGAKLVVTFVKLAPGDYEEISRRIAEQMKN